MKVVYIILLSFICALNAFANNEYQSFVKDGKSWHYAIGSRSYCYKIQGDTIIDNQTFSKLYRQDVQSYGDSQWHYFAALKESDKKVYIRYADAAEIKLLHDFGIDKYDEYMMPDSTYIRCNYRTVEEIKGISRNVYGVNPYRKDREENPTLGLIMVEGIGFESHIDVFDTGTWMQLHPRLERCYEDNMLIYGNSDYTPLVREGVKWNCVMRRVNRYHPELSFNHHYSIQIKGDTIINEVQYKKCYYIFEDKDEPSNVIPRAYLREDIENQQVFVLFNDKYSTEKGTGNLPYTNPYIEHLLYDFKQRDNASQYWINMGPTDYASTEIIDKLMLEGTEKEIYRLSLFASYGMRIGNFELVEGIGLCRNIWLTYNHSYPGDLLMPDPSVYGSGDNFLPVFLNFEDAEGNIVYVAQEYNGVEGVAPDRDNATESARYDLYGRRLSQPAQGVNIIKMSDGTIRKEVVK